MKIQVFASLFALLLASGAEAGLINGGFELPAQSVTTVSIIDASFVTGWSTTATDNKIEIWSNSFNGVTSYQGNQHAELNANQVSTLYQNATGIGAGSNVGYQFAHRGRAGVDSMRFTLTDLGIDGLFGTGDDTQLFTQIVSDGNTAWGFYNGSGITALGNTVRFSFISVSAAGGNQGVGNFLDAADFGVGVGAAVSEPGALALIGLALAALGLSRCRS